MQEIITAIFDHLKDKKITFDWKTFSIEATDITWKIEILDGDTMISSDLVEQVSEQLAKEMKEQIDNDIIKHLFGEDKDMGNRLIGVCGLIGSGKDTIGEELVNNYGFTKLSFAGTLKDVTATLFDWDREMLEGTTPETRAQREVLDPFWTEKLGRDWSPRIALQQLGTEVIRNHLHEDMWLLTVENKLRKLGDVVITDCRFPNEIAFVQKHGEIWQVDRGNKPDWWDYAVQFNTAKDPDTRRIMYDIGTTPEQLGVHASEYSWAGVDAKHLLDNNSTIEMLHNRIKSLV